MIGERIMRSSVFTTGSVWNTIKANRVEARRAVDDRLLG
jgi:hypothetical protein